MNEVPSLAKFRPGLPPKVAEWVEGVLAGKTQAEIADEMGVSTNAVSHLGTHLSTVAGLPYDHRAGGTREAVLRMRIRELEERS